MFNKFLILMSSDPILENTIKGLFSKEMAEIIRVSNDNKFLMYIFMVIAIVICIVVVIINRNTTNNMLKVVNSTTIPYTNGLRDIKQVIQELSNEINEVNITFAKTQINNLGKEDKLEVLSKKIQKMCMLQQRTFNDLSSILTDHSRNLYTVQRDIDEAINNISLQLVEIKTLLKSYKEDREDDNNEE